jgi:adenosine deaminase
MIYKNIPDKVVNLPKVELHLHLEGAFTFECLYNLIQRYGGDPEIESISDLQKKFVFTDFQQFIDTWYWKNKFFRKPEDFEEAAYKTIASLIWQRIMYAEVFFSPWEFVSPGIKPEDVIEATISGVKKAVSKFRIKCNLIADLIRNLGAETAMQRLDQVTPYLGKGIIGIGLGGDERNYPAYLFKDVFIEARKRGFRTTAHAGEAAGPESVWSAIKDLKAERIGHGVRAVEDPALMEYLKKEQVPLEVCITSNVQTKVFPGLKEHPFDKMYKEGFMVTLNSDDPSMFGANLVDEMGMLYSKLNYTMEDLANLTRNAIASSFADEEEKEKLSRVINIYAGLIDYIDE